MGFCLGIKKGRGRTKNTGALAFGFLLFYYALFFFGVSLAKKGTLSPVVCVFLPTLILFIISGYLYKRLDWVS